MDGLSRSREVEERKTEGVGDGRTPMILRLWTNEIFDTPQED